MNVRVSPVVFGAVLVAVSIVGGELGGGARADDGPSYTIEDVTACSADAMRLCRSKMPDISAIEDCMKAHYEQLRPKCKARFDRDH